MNIIIDLVQGLAYITPLPYLEIEARSPIVMIRLLNSRVVRIASKLVTYRTLIDR